MSVTVNQKSALKADLLMITKFISVRQFSAIFSAINGEEGTFFKDKIN